MRVDVILADAAQSVGGKVHLIGGGWSVLRTPAPISVVVFVEVPWDATNTPMAFKLELVNADGHLVELPGPAGPQSIVVTGNLEAGRPPGHPHGTPVTLPPLAVSLAPMPLTPGRYVFRVSIDDYTEENWQRSFTFMSGPMPA